MDFDMLSVLDKIADNVPQTSDGDYIGNDGLIYCSVCRTPKQCRVTLFGQERIMPCICDCIIKQEEAKKEAQKKNNFEIRVNRLRAECFPESSMQNWTFANDDKQSGKLMTAMYNFAENFDKFKENGKGLLLFGGVGTGKSYAAACVANALIDKGIPVLMTNFAHIANTAFGMTEGKQAYYDSLNDYPLLIIDDLAAERKTEYMQEIVYTVVDNRYRAKLPLIVTSNLTAQEIKNPSDVTNQRIFSRLLEMCYPFEVKGIDRRREKLKNDFEYTKNLLGI